MQKICVNQECTLKAFISKKSFKILRKARCSAERLMQNIRVNKNSTLKASKILKSTLKATKKLQILRKRQIRQDTKLTKF